MEISSFKMNDNTFLPDYTIQTEGSTTAVLCIHGITSELDMFAAFGKLLHRKLNYDIHIPILRGYHDSQRHGDFESDTQYDQDIESMLLSLRLKYKRVYVLGHSIGSGSVFRYMQERKSNLIDHAVLTAPFLHPAHKVFKEAEEGENDGTYKLFFKKALLAGTLNKMGIKILDNTSIVEIPLRTFPLDPASPLKTHSLSYRLMMSRFIKKEEHFDHIDYSRITFITGEKDEIIDINKAETFFDKHIDSKLLVVKDEDHNTILTSSQLLKIFDAI